ncbi:MAG: hypothetical protein K6A69_06745 [Lachnospiraceae bacterium]|nr:hypothetical protein [Lachnospiraceae bacterium]
MSMKEEYRIKVLEVPRELAGAFGELDDGTHLSGLGQNGVHGFTVVEDREEGYVPVALTVFSKKGELLSNAKKTKGNDPGEKKAQYLRQYKALKKMKDEYVSDDRSTPPNMFTDQYIEKQIFRLRLSK